MFWACKQCTSPVLGQPYTFAMEIHAYWIKAFILTYSRESVLNAEGCLFWLCADAGAEGGDVPAWR